MNNWETLPYEILNTIFLYLKSYYCNSQNDLAQCALACRGWRVNAQALYFYAVRLSTLKQFDNIDHLVSNNSLMGRWVKTLEVAYDNGQDDLLKMDTLFPCLEEIEFDNATFSYSLFSKMLIEDGKFCYLKKIPQPLDESECEPYLQCLMFIKNRVNHIYFTGCSYEAAIYAYIHDKLSQFPNLKQFHLNIDDDEESPCFFLDHLENLTKNGTSSIEKYRLKISECMPPSMPYNTEKLKSGLSIHPAIHLEQLILEVQLHITGFPLVALPQDEFILYIVKKFSNLNRMILRNGLYEESMYCSPMQELDYKHVSKTVAIEFLKYVAKMSFGSIQHYITSSRDNTAEIIHHGLYPDIEENSTKLISRYHHLNMLQRNSTTMKEAKNEYPHVFINFLVKNSNYSTWLRFNNCTSDQLFQQKRHLIEKIGRFFTHITLEVSNSKELALIFKHVAEYCVQLNNLEILGRRTFEYHEEALPTNHNIKRLALSGHLPSLEQLQYIVNQLPCLETFVLDISLLLRRRADVNNVLFSSIYLPNTSLKCLVLHLEDQLNHHGNTIDHLFLPIINGPHIVKLIIESKEKQTRHYFLNAKPSSGGGYRIITDLMEDDFKDTIDNSPSIVTFQIYCKTVEKLIIKYHVANYRIVRQGFVL